MSGEHWLSSIGCQDELVVLFESLVDVMFCAKDAQGVYREVNAAFVRRTGRRSKRDVIGRTASDLFSAERATQYEGQDQKVFESGRPLQDQLELIRRPSGDLGWYLTTKLPIGVGNDGLKAAGLVSVSRDLSTAAHDGDTVESLQPVVTHIREHLNERLRVGDLAAVAGCSASQLDRRVRRVFGLSVTQYVLRVRVDRAVELLTKTDAALADIALIAGFYDQPDFSRRFARLTGRTPARFRADANDLIG